MSGDESQRVLLPTDYEAIRAAVMETTRGRSFLEEFARRNRTADTILILSAIRDLTKGATGQRAGDGLAQQLTAAAAPDTSAHAEAEPIIEQGRAALMAILSAVERIQETGWRLQAKGSDPECCGVIDAQVRAIYQAAPLQELALVSLAQTQTAPAEQTDAA